MSDKLINVNERYRELAQAVVDEIDGNEHPALVELAKTALHLEQAQLKCSRCDVLWRSHEHLRKELWYAKNRLRVMNSVATNYTHEYDEKGNEVQREL